MGGAADRSGVYKLPMVRMFHRELTNLRMYGSKAGRGRNAAVRITRSRCGSVKICSMKDHDVLQAHASRQDYSRHLKAYVQIGITERGKVSAFLWERGRRRTISGLTDAEK